MLEWVRPDAYHYATTCGTFSVSRMKAGGQLWYTAWRRPDKELASLHCPLDAPEATRAGFLKVLQQACANAERPAEVYIPEAGRSELELVG